VALSLLENLQLLFPTCSGLLPKLSVVLIDRVPRQLSAFVNLPVEEGLHF
jgi:hypothetical protein